MKNFKFIIPVAFLALAACSPATHTADTAADGQDSLTSQNADTSVSTALFAKMQIKDTIKAGEPVELKFTVYNNADSVQHFCKWHTPFEPLMSKYLTVKDANGQEADYKGAMAKRIMPPPADSYLKVNAKDSLSANVDVLKGYNIQNAGKYVITYEGQNMSGLIVKDSVSFVYIK